MGYLAQYDAARTANFLKLVEMAITVAARDVVAEAKTVSNHYNRVVLATQVLREPANWTQAFKDGVAANGVTDADADAAFYAAVMSYLDAMAGVTFNGALVP